MPSNLPSSFASAAAGQNATRDARGGRSDGRGPAGGEWSRRDGRSANGTLTFRRSSTTPLSQSSNLPPASDHAVQSPSVEAPIAQPTTYEVGPSRYTKDDLLEMYHSQRPSGNPSHLFISGWDPSNGSNAGVRGWGKSSENHVPQDPGTCWDVNGDTEPIGLQGFSPEEREAFSSDINSPLKPPTQTNKEGHQTAVNGRKPSLSHAPGTTFGVSSPSSAVRPSTRRRETVDSNPFSPTNLASPTATSRFSRDDPLWFSRKGGDLRESEIDDPDIEQASRDVPKLPIGGLIRSNTSTGVSMGSMWPSSSTSGAGASAGGFGNFALPTSPAVGDKRPGGASGGSRLAHLIPKDSAEGAAGKSSEAQNPPAQQSWRTRPRTDTDPFGGDEELSGSAVLGGAQDTGSGGPQPPNRAGILGTPVKGSAGDFGMSGLNLGGQSSGDNGPVSPSETNPYRSPPAERHDHDGPDPGAGDKIHSTGHEQQQPHSNYSTLSRGFAAAFDGSDRSQTSSVGAKAYLSGGWPAPAGPSTGTPDRERSNFGGAFGSSLFSPIGDMQSPGLGNLGGVFGPSNTGSIGRGSKLGSLFPPAMQAQMQAHEQESSLADSLGDLRQSNPLGAIGRGNFIVPTRDTDSPMRSNRGVFEELFPSSDNSRNLAAFGASDAGQPNIAATVPQSFTPVSGGLPFGNAQAGVELPSAQVRQMVMPDRMRWVYLDPQGQIQGPFTGLEMNDWYKANFFTPDLRVKKVEDPEFEPLGQLIRRIGNSREPFLVPQIGIAHGPPMQSGPFGPGTGSGIIPPLSGVFPTFGRTLTAEEQNNLERRKQEEQFLMAQQRDFMMRQQAMAKFQIQPSLQHHSSAHSLQSQPSFGSITSPLGVPQQQHHQLQHQQPIGALGPAGVFDVHPGANPAAIRAAMGNGELFRPEDLANLSINERQMLASLQGEPTGTESGAPQPIGTPGDASLRYGLPEANELKEDDEGFKDRLQEFEDLRAEHDAAQAAAIVDESQESSVRLEETIISTMTAIAVEPLSEPVPSASKASKASKKKTTIEESSLSLTQQVQKTQASVAAAAAVPPPPQPTEPGMPMPFPPPASTTPLPAPTAQRARSNLPEQFSRSQTGTPDAIAQPPPLAPWAKDPGQEGQKGPSLKEIQEAEARKAAKAEEAAAALRKAAMEQEAALLREKEKSAAVAAAAANAGLPATSTWGQSSPVSSVSPWAKPGATKAKGATPITASTAAGAKKTLAEIQREEEARKLKAKEVAIQTGGGAPISIGKSYANLAGKPNHGSTPTAPSPILTAGSGWATVGAGGKVKSPSTVPSQLQSRSASTSSAKPVVIAPVKLAPKSIISGTSVRAEPINTAMDEFNKWAYRELSRGITGVTDITSFQADLAVLPLDTGLIADAVYANSTTMDGRHFSEEYVRRKRLAEKGVVEKQPQAESKSSSSSGGWNEVAKKSGAAQPRESEAMQSADFKVVPGRKKSKK